MRDWRGPIAFVLAAGVAIALVLGVLTAELSPSKITTEEISFLATLGGAAIGAVSAYLGIRHIEPRDTTDDRQEPPESNTEQFDALQRDRADTLRKPGPK